MKIKQHYSGFLSIAMISMLCISCKQEKMPTLKTDKQDAISHGYNELAHPDSDRVLTISDYNTDNPEVKNIDRPAASTVKTDLDTELLFDMWTTDPDGPHADFDLTSKSFLVVDYDGDGEMPYELINRNLKIYYNDFIQEGKVISVDKDTLRIIWNDFEDISKYVRWRQ